jgi:uncharacterized OB-fold protein
MSDQKLEAKTFFENVKNGVLVGSRCLNCGHVSLPQRYICPQCKSDQAELVEFSGNGKLTAYTVIYVPATEMLAAGYDAKHPYMVGIVTLDEGPRISAQIVGMDLTDPSKIKVGTALKMTTLDRTVGDVKKKVLAFEPQD